MPARRFCPSLTYHGLGSPTHGGGVSTRNTAPAVSLGGVSTPEELSPYEDLNMFNDKTLDKQFEDGTVVLPDEIFSYNRCINPRR